MPRQILAYVGWHDNITTTAVATVPGVKSTDPAALALLNADLHLKLKASEDAKHAAMAANTALSLSIAASQDHARPMVKDIKNDPTYDEVLGNKLRIVGADDATDLSQIQTTLKLTATNGGVVKVEFDKPHAEGAHLYCKIDGQADFTLLASVTHSPFIDSRPLAVPGKPEVRSYRAILFHGTTEFGLMSSVVVITAIP